MPRPPLVLPQRRCLGALFVALVAGALAAGVARAETGAREVLRGPRPSWVVPLEPAPVAAGDASGGVDYLLMDDQVRVTESSTEHWARRVRRVTSIQGVEAESQFQLDWDPSHETLTLHRLVVWRDGVASDRLASAGIDVVRREPNFEASLLDGTLSALVVLHDVRPGDVIDHEFTTSGRDPVYAGRWFGGFRVNWDGPIRRLGYRALWPAARAVRWRGAGVEADPVLRRLGDETEATWLFTDVPPASVEPDQPTWHDGGGWVQLSDFASWEDLSRWGEALYDQPGQGAAFDDLVRRIRAEGGDDEARALAALRFVQDDVRYLGLEGGSGSMRPSPPAVVLDRRFGDCKDKVLLLVALLRALGLRADPALVSTTDGAQVANRLPSPADFDHAIVRLQAGGRACWLDATIAGQRGPLASRHVPRYGKALVLAPGTTDLEDVVPAPGDAPLTEVSVRFVLPSVGGPALMTVRTAYHGRDADETRADLAGESREETRRAYAEYYARVYPSVEPLRGLVVRDDEAANVLVTEEAYRIGSLWEMSDDGTTWTADFHAPEIEECLTPIDDARRESPLAVDHPHHVVHHAVIELPDDWSVPPAEREIDGLAATFSKTVSADKRRVDLRYEWRTKRDWIPAADVVEHAALVEQAYELTGFRLSAGASGRPLSAGPRHGGTLNWSVLALALMTGLAGAAGGVVLCLWVPVRASRPDEAPAASEPAAGAAEPVASEGAEAEAPPASPASPPPPSPAARAALGFIALALPLGLLASLMRSLPPYQLERWNALTVPGPSHEPLAAPLLLLGLVSGVLLLMMSAVLMPLLLMRRSAFRAVAAIAALGGLCTEALRLVGSRLVPAAFPAALDGTSLGVATLMVVPIVAWIVAAPRVKAHLSR